MNCNQIESWSQWRHTHLYWATCNAALSSNNTFRQYFLRFKYRNINIASTSIPCNTGPYRHALLFNSQLIVMVCLPNSCWCFSNFKNVWMYSINILTLSLLLDVAHSEGHDILLMTLISNHFCLSHHGNHFLPLHHLTIIHAACLTHLLSETYIYRTYNTTTYHISRLVK